MGLIYKDGYAAVRTACGRELILSRGGCVLTFDPSGMRIVVTGIRRAPADYKPQHGQLGLILHYATNARQFLQHYPRYVAVYDASNEYWYWIDERGREQAGRSYLFLLDWHIEYAHVGTPPLFSDDHGGA